MLQRRGEYIWCTVLILACTTAVTSGKGDRVRLSSVEVLTLREGQMTSARRNKAVPQLKCISGCHYERPDAVQCYNRGSDGNDVQWECKTEMSRGYHFGKTEVSCEGYDYPDDDYILSGSCGLEYELKATGDSRQTTSWTTKSEGFSMGSLFVLAIIGFAIYTLYQKAIAARTTGGFNGGAHVSPPPYSSQPQPVPYGFGAEYMPASATHTSQPQPPPYGFGAEYIPGSGTPSSSCHGSTLGGSATMGSSAGVGGANGFWGGAATGGILGYLFGRRSGQSTAYPTYYPSNSNTFSAAPSGYTPSSSSGRHTVSGFANTKRR